MSTLVVTSLRHTSSSSNNVVLDSGGNATFVGNMLFNSGYGSAAIAYGCRAWVNFNGQGTVAIRASGNISSITDNNVGDYTVNFTTAMPDANYCAIAHNKILDVVSRVGLTSIDNRLAGWAQIRTFRGADTYPNLTAFDPSLVELAIFR